MQTYKLQTSLGTTFSSVSKEAQELSFKKDAIVEFYFNGIKCFVYKSTNLNNLYRDYDNAWFMNWKKIGPFCAVEYSEETLTEIKRAEEYRKKEEQEREEFINKTKGIQIELKDKDQWDKFCQNNQDSYGTCTIEYAEGWAKLMQAELLKGSKLEDIAKKTSFELGFLGISGFMYGCAVSILSQCWKYGEELRVWHNSKYNVKETEGVVNPAVISLK